MFAWKIMACDTQPHEEVAFIDEQGRISGVWAESIRKYLVKMGWPKKTPAEIYGYSTFIEVKKIHPKTGEELPDEESFVNLTNRQV